jgi:hypothetical protein
MTAAPRCVRKGAAVPCLRCAECRVAAKDARIAALFGMPPPAAAAAAKASPPPAKRRIDPAVPLPCVRRGEPTGETRQCATCTATKDVPLMSCAEFGVCTTHYLAPGIPCCRICKSRAEESAPSALPTRSRPLV